MSIIKSFSRPDEMSALFKLKFGKQPPLYNSKNDKLKYSNDLKYCYNTLDQVSRSFAVVIRQLPYELSVGVCLFYLILRALDSIEDDMNCPKDLKVKLLREFHTYSYQENWTISNIGDKEEYRDLLANYDKVSRAFLSIDKKYRDIISDICQKMGSGMADFVEVEIHTLKDYDLYCHHVAGLVGVGLSQIFSVSEIEDNDLKFQNTLSNSMGLFLQKTNIIRDYKEDLEENRTFWPKEIWSLYASNLETFSKAPKTLNSISCLNHLVNNALNHVIDCLEYLKKIKHIEVFKFCAIPQVMAIATLCEVYNNPKVFIKNVKIRKGFAAKLILNANSIHDVIKIYKNIILAIESKISVKTPKSKETQELIDHIKNYFSTNKDLQKLN